MEVMYYLTSHVQSEGGDMGVDHREVERRQVKVAVGKGNKHGTVDEWVSGVNLTSWLEGETSVVAGHGKVGVGEIQLRAPSNIFRSAGRSGGNVGVVGANSHARSFPLEEDLLAGER